MNCPFCGAALDPKANLRQCTHCGSSIFTGIEAYTKPKLDIRMSPEEIKRLERNIEKNSKDQPKVGVTTEGLDKLVQKEIKGRLQLTMESIGFAGIYSLILTIIASPLIYFIVQPRFFQSYAVTTLIMASYLFYFVFGFAVIYTTTRTLSD